MLTFLQNNTNPRKFVKAYANITKESGVKGEKRIKVINKAFDVIMNYLIPDTFSFMLAHTKIEGSDEGCVDFEKSKKLQK